MSMLLSVFGALLKPLLDFFRQRHSDDENRKQTERLAREAAVVRATLERTIKEKDNAELRRKIDETVGTLPDADLIGRLRNGGSTPPVVPVEPANRTDS